MQTTAHEHFNPMTIRCRSCGAPANFDIIAQNYHCANCGAQTEVATSLEQLNTWRTQKQASNSREWRQHPKAVYHCPGCGATVTVDENEALTQCVFCGSSIVRSEFNDQTLLPEAVIPFKLTLDEAKQRLREWIEKNASKPEAKLLQSRVEELRGYYLPYQMVKGPVACNVQRLATSRYYVCRTYLNGTAVNTSKQLDNLVLNGMEPFDWSELFEFDFNLVAGHGVKMQDIDQETITARTIEEVEDDIRPVIEKAMQTQEVECHSAAEDLLTLPVMLPAYVICTGNVKVAINGQTGRIAVSCLKPYVSKRWLIEPTIITILGFLASCVMLHTDEGPLTFAKALRSIFLLKTQVSGALMLAFIIGIIAFCAIGQHANKKRFALLQTKKSRADRDGETITYHEGDDVLPDSAPAPVFMEVVNNLLSPVAVHFYSIGRICKWIAAAVIFNLLPILLVVLFKLPDILSVKSFAPLAGYHYSYNGIWLVLSIPVTFIIYLAALRRDIYDFPIFSLLQPNGTTRRLRKSEINDQIRFVNGLSPMKALPKNLKLLATKNKTGFFFLVLFTLFMLFGTMQTIVSD